MRPTLGFDTWVGRWAVGAGLYSLRDPLNTIGPTLLSYPGAQGYSGRVGLKLLPRKCEFIFCLSYDIVYSFLRRIGLADPYPRPSRVSIGRLGGGF